jgi:hypothetical protein
VHCAIRTSCVWWFEYQDSACRRCPQVATYDSLAGAEFRAITAPPKTNVDEAA